MLKKIDKFDQKHIDKGNIGESFIKWYCVEAANYTYKKSSLDENIYSGVDAYIESIPTDIKNTKSIFFGRVYKKTNKFFVRHPFRTETKAIDYLILNVEENKFEITYHGNIESYLTTNFFKSQEHYFEFKKHILNFDQKNVLDTYISIEQFLYRLKMDIQSFFKDDVIVKYSETNFERNEEISIRFIKKTDFETEKLKRRS